MKVKSESGVTQSCPTLCDPMDYKAYQAPWSTGFSRQEYWSGVPLPSEPISNSFGDLDTYQDTIPHNQDNLERSTAKNLMPMTLF